MPWNGCKFEGDPQTPAELFSKAQYSDPETNDSLSDEGASWFEGGLGWYVGGGRLKTRDVLGACNAVVGKEDEYPCAVSTATWDGGLSYFDDDNDPEAFASLLNAGVITFDVIGKVARLGSVAIKMTALNDYKKDMSGVKDKMQVAKNNYAQAKVVTDGFGNQIIGLGGQLDGLTNNLASIQESLISQWQGIESILGELSALSSSLSSAEGRLTKANADLAYANNRANFPPGIAGATAQKNARIQANANIATASTQIVDIKGDINEKGVDLRTASDARNATGAQGEAVAGQILNGQTAITALKSSYDSSLAPLRGAVNLRNGALQDVGIAQNNLAGKLETSTALAQTATGASGVSEALKYLSAGEHLRATGSAVNTGIELGSGYVPDLVPYVPLLKTAVSVGFDTLQSGGNVKSLAENLGEAFIGYKSSQRIFYSVEGALTIMPQDPYTAWQIIAVESHDGVGVLGKIATTGSVFMGPIPVAPFIPLLTPIAQGAVSGSLSTAIEAGQKIATDELFSAEIGSGSPSGLSVVLGGLFATVFYGPSAKIKNAINKVFDIDGRPTDENTALAIQRMAMTRAEKAPIPNFQIGPGMRRLKYPKSDNFSGEVLE